MMNIKLISVITHKSKDSIIDMIINYVTANPKCEKIINYCAAIIGIAIMELIIARMYI